MIEPNKLREGSDFVAKLLLAGMGEGPSPSAKRAVGRALGVSFAVAVSATAASASSRIVEAVATASVAKVGFGFVAKWCAIGFLAGTVATAGVVLPTMALRSNERSQAPRFSTASLATAAPTLPPPAGPATERSAEAVPTPAPLFSPAGDRGAASSNRRSTESAATSAPSVASRPAAEAVPSLSREVELLERVRERLRAGDAGGALAELDRVEPGVVSLAMEAKLLRIEALLANGERGRAEALALELERRYPGGPLGFRLKRLLSGP